MKGQRWVEVRRTFAPPIRNVSRLNGVDPEEAEKILFGITVIEFHDTKTVEHLALLHFQEITDE